MRDAGSRGSGHDRNQRLDPDDVHNPGQIVGQDREGHLGGHLWERFWSGSASPPCGAREQGGENGERRGA
jgi:hypothetical protein